MLTDPKTQGLVWSSGWSGLYEGPFSLLMKMTLASSVDATFIAKHFYGAYSRVGGMRLSTPRMRVHAQGDLDGQILDALVASSQSRLMGDMCDLLVDEAAFRYCPECMKHGYQAAVAQIAGVQECPIHQVPYLAACLACGARTPQYCLRLHSSGRCKPSFNCVKCGQSYAPGSDIERRPGLWQAPQGVLKLKPLHKWLEVITDPEQLCWENRAAWNTTVFDAMAEDLDYRQRAAFQILQHIEPCHVARAPADVMVLGPYQLGDPAEIPKAFDANIRRMARAIFGPVKVRRYGDGFTLSNCTAAIPINLESPLAAHAVALASWQFHHPWPLDVASYDSLSCFRRGYCATLEGLRPPAQMATGPAWASELVKGYLQAVWEASLRIARQWRETLTLLTESKGGPLTALDCAPHISRRRLGCWRDYGYEPVAVIVTRSSWRPGGRQVYFAVG